MKRRDLLRATAAFGAVSAISCQSQPATTEQSAAPSGPRISVRDHGALADGSTDDAPAIRRAIDAARAAGAGATVVFPKGRYLLRTATRAQIKTPYATLAGASDVWTEREAHILLQGARGITLEGEPGTLLVLTSYAAAGILLERCADVTLRELAIDYDPLPFTQGTVTALDPSGGSLDLRVDQGFPVPTEDRFRTATQTYGTVRDGRAPEIVKSGAGAGGFGDVLLPTFATIARAGDTYRLPVPAVQQRGVALGDRLVLPARSNVNGQPVAQFFTERCTLDRVTVHSSPVVAFMLQHCDSPVFRDCVIEPLGGGRLLSTNADGIHCKWARGAPIVERCRFTAMHDDGFTFHALADRVLRVDGSALVVERSEQYRAGDEIAVIDQATGGTRATARVQEAALVRWRDRLGVRLVLDRAVADVVAYERLSQDGLPARDAPETRNAPRDRRADLVADLSTLGTGFVVRDSIFAKYRGSNRAYAGGTIERNRFEQISLYPLRAGLDLYWPEAYHASKLVVRDNTFVGNTGGPNVWVEDVLGDHRRGSALGNRDITIERNRFEGYGRDGAISLNNVDGVRVSGNSFAAADRPAITIGLARDVSIDGSTASPLVVAYGAGADRASIRVAGAAATAHRASLGFSGQQGAAHWRYRSWDGTRFQDLAYDAVAEQYTGPAFLLIARERMHPGASADAVRSWTADAGATLRITGRVRKLAIGGDGVRAEVIHGSETIWAADLAGDDVTGVAYDVTRRVARGDEVHFRLSRRGNANNDASSWDPMLIALGQ